MPRIMWEDDLGETMVFDGIAITMTAFRAMYGKLLQDTKDLLLNDVLMGLELPNLDHEHIYDDLSCVDIGYSFITDTRNKYRQHALFLISAMLSADKFGSKFIYAEHCNENGIVWNVRAVHIWFKTCERCLGNLFLLLQYGAGQPARGTELAILTLINTIFHARNIYWFKKLVNIVTTYNKTQTNLDKPRVISRSLPPPVGELYILWMTFVVPTLITVAGCLEAPRKDISTRFRDYLFTSFNGVWDTDDLSNLLMAVSCEPVAQYGLGHAMGIADTRHFLIAIMRKHLRGIANNDMLEEYFNEQSGHADDAAEKYAISFDTIRNVSEDRLAVFVQLSRRQHNFLFPDCAPAVTPSRTLPDDSGVCSDGSQVDYQKLAAVLVPPVSSQLATLLAPGLQKNIVDAYASLIPIHQPPPPPESLRSQEAQRGALIVDVNDIEISPQRYSELRGVMGNGASFKSAAQACAVELSARRENDLLVILGTGGGKSLVFMTAAVNAAEATAGLATVVIVPLLALLDDLQMRLKEKNIKQMRWTSAGIRHYNTRIILVSADLAGTDAFLAYFLEGCTTGRIGRCVMDEAHYILTSAHFRPVLLNIKRLRAGMVPFVFLTATLPPAATLLLFEKVHVLPSSTLIVRTPTVRQEIVYSCFKLTGRQSAEYFAKDGTRRSIADYISSILDMFGVGARALMFCISKSDADCLAAMLGSQSHHSDMTRECRETVLTNWKEGKHNILTTTSSLGSGLDYPNIALVGHYGKPRNIIDYAQESGRAARQLRCGHSTIFFDPAARDLPLQEGQTDLGVAEMTAFVTTPQCRRVTLGGSLDGKDSSCFAIFTASLCDWCENQVPRPNIVRILNHLASHV
jgi:superfamily II DNA helicase RecQ